MKLEKLTPDEMESLKIKLRKQLPRGSRIYLILRSVSRSGTSRVISPYRFITTGKKNEVSPDPLECDVAQVLGYRLSDHPEGIKVAGCGMDMGFALVYALSQALYGAENRGGYALTHCWL
jgi:hypothetical protein